VVDGKLRIRNLVPLRQDIDAMTELKPLTYDEHKAAEAAFRGYPADPDWTDAAQLLYVKLSEAVAKRAAEAVCLSVR
jgi:hypothetical protein